MPQQHIVQAGDTVSAIAKRFGVPTSSVSGFRSNDPNTIFPGETLNIQPSVASPDDPNNITASPATPQNTANIVDQSALQATGGQNVVAPTPDIPIPQESTANITPAEAPTDAGQGAITEAVKQSGETPQAIQQLNAPQPTTDIPTFEQALASAGLDTAEVSPGVFRTMSGAEVNEQGQVINPPEEQADQALGQFGISGDAVAEGFQTNPFGTLSEIVQQVMQATGLPDVREQVTKMANEIEDLENERDSEIAQAQDDPFSSVSSKRQIAQNISDKYDKRINARVNRLTLLQSAQQDARQQAQFAATTAINLFGQQQQFQAQQIEDILDREEKVAEAQAKLNEPLSVAEAKALGVPFGTTRAEAFGITPQKDVGDSGLPNTVIRQVDALSSKFDASPIVKQFNEVQNKSRSIQAIVDEGIGGPADLALVFEFMKSLDPTSVVRESEYDVASNAGNPFKRIAAQMGGYVSEGQFLPEEVKDEFARLSNIKMSIVERQYDNLFSETGRKINMKTGQEDGTEYLTDYKSAFEPLEGQERQTDEEAIFDEVVGTQSSGNYLQNLWGALVGA